MIASEKSFAEWVEYPAVFVLTNGEHYQALEPSQIHAIPKDKFYKKQGILWNGATLYVEWTA